MSMYLSNRDVGPIGVEPGEFIDFLPTADELDDQTDTEQDPPA